MLRNGRAGLRRLAVVTAAGLVATMAAAFGGVSTATAADGDPVIFRVGMLQDVDSLNPYKGITAAAYEMWALTYDSLTKYGAADFAPEPNLAESWDTSEDGLTWTYNLVQNASFSDGTPLTSEDVVYSFERVMNGKVEKTNWGSYVKQIESVTASDEFTVVMQLKKVTPLMERLSVPDRAETHLGAGRRERGTQVPERARLDASRQHRLRSVHPDRGARGRSSTPSRPTPTTGARHPRSTAWNSTFFRNADAMVQALESGQIDFADDLDAQRVCRRSRISRTSRPGPRCTTGSTT